MAFINRGDMHFLIKKMAKLQGISMWEVRQRYSEQIENMKYSDDPDQQALYQKLFGNRTPSPEEFLKKMTKYAMK